MIVTAICFGVSLLFLNGPEVFMFLWRSLMHKEIVFWLRSKNFWSIIDSRLTEASSWFGPTMSHQKKGFNSAGTNLSSKSEDVPVNFYLGHAIIEFLKTLEPLYRTWISSLILSFSSCSSTNLSLDFLNSIVQIHFFSLVDETWHRWT